MADELVVLVTAPSEAEAARIGGALLEGRLAACVNIVSGVRSLYRWKGRICDDPEVLMLIKTTRARYGEVENEVRRLHGYDVPEIIALDIERGSAGYLGWLQEQCGPG